MPTKMPLIPSPLFAWNIVTDAPDLMVLAVLALVVASSLKMPLMPPFGQSLGRSGDAEGESARDPHAAVNWLLAVTLVVGLFFLGLSFVLRMIGRH
jgi:hypothetical protein